MQGMSGSTDRRGSVDVNDTGAATRLHLATAAMGASNRNDGKHAPAVAPGPDFLLAGKLAGPLIASASQSEAAGQIAQSIHEAIRLEPIQVSTPPTPPIPALRRVLADFDLEAGHSNPPPGGSASATHSAAASSNPDAAHNPSLCSRAACLTGTWIGLGMGSLVSFLTCVGVDTPGPDGLDVPDGVTVALGAATLGWVITTALGVGVAAQCGACQYRRPA